MPLPDISSTPQLRAGIWPLAPERSANGVPLLQWEALSMLEGLEVSEASWEAWDRAVESFDREGV
jgi:hypothetical protein